MRAGIIEMEQFRQVTETLDSFDAFLERAVAFMPQRAEAHLRYSLTHSLRETDDGRYTWKQDHRPRPKPTAEAPRWAALADDVRRIRVPTLLFRGAESKILAQDAAERMTKSMHDARLVVIQRATHNVHSDNPRDWARALDAFLSETLAEAPG